MEKVPGRDIWAVIDSVTHMPALVNDVPQIDLDLYDADDLAELLNRLDGELWPASSTEGLRSGLVGFLR
jgi:hypothetical protein